MEEQADTTSSETEIEDIDKSTKDYILKNDLRYIFLFVVLSILSIFAAFIWGLGIPAIAIVVPLVIIIGFFGYFRILIKIRQQFIQEFGKENGLVYSNSVDIQTVSGKFFTVGHSRRIFNVLSGVIDGRSSRIFSYAVTIGYGKGATTYEYTVFDCLLESNIPDIIVTSPSTLLFESSSLFDSATHIQLEGDFNKYFSISVPKGYETTVYEVLTPDVMTILIDKAKGLSFEFNGHHLYIYTEKTITTRDEMQALFDLAKYLDNLFAQSSHSVGVAGEQN